MLSWDRMVLVKVPWHLCLAGREDYEVTEGSVEFLGKESVGTVT